MIVSAQEIRKPKLIFINKMDNVYAILEPDSFIEFDFSPKITSTSTLSIKNIISQNIAFKVKTTAQKSYIVRPNQGIINPNDTQELIITMQPLLEYPGDVNHRFLVQTAPTDLSTDQLEDLTKFWTNPPPSSQNAKLSVLISDPNKFQSTSSFQTIFSENKAEKYENLKNEIKDLNEFQDKQEKSRKNKEIELEDLVLQQKKRDEEINRVESEGLKGYGIVHIILIGCLGVLVGYLYSIGKS